MELKQLKKKFKKRVDVDLLIQSLHFVPSYQGCASLTRHRRLESRFKTNEEVKQKKTKKLYIAQSQRPLLIIFMYFFPLYTSATAACPITSLLGPDAPLYLRFRPLLFVLASF